MLNSMARARERRFPLMAASLLYEIVELVDIVDFRKDFRYR